MKSIEIRQITTTGKASVIVVNPYLVRNIVFNLIKLENFAQFIRDSRRIDEETGQPVFVPGDCALYVPDSYLDDIYNSVLPFLQQLDNAITNNPEE